MLNSVRIIFFDAVGTLIRPEPGVATTYQRLGHRYGSRLSVEEVESRFRAAFRRQQEYDRQHGWRTDDQRELQRWQAIIREVFAELPDTSDLFRELWQHFARPDSWSCFPEVATTLCRLEALGYPLGIASNFDQRLRPICQGLPALRPCRWLMISSELGWLKPAPQFFQTIAESLRVEPCQLLYVGDDYRNDCLAALQAGWQAVWLCRESASSIDKASPDKCSPGQQSTGADKQAAIPSLACPVIVSLQSLVELITSHGQRSSASDRCAR